MRTDVRVWRADEAELHNFSRNSYICNAPNFHFYITAQPRTQEGSHLKCFIQRKLL